jgi:hypothetical protein
MDQETIIATIRNHYPRAEFGSKLVKQWFTILQNELKLPPKKLMVANCVCSDDVNAIQYPEEARETLGPFNMGGLDGFPFAGLTGMNAFAHHVPSDGALSIFYGPHIGITKEGELGKIYRIGQNVSSNCCGACHAALNKLLTDKIILNEITDIDYQQNILEQILLKEETRIRVASSPLKEATEVIFESIEKRIRLLVSQTYFPCKYVFLYGVIILNSDYNIGAFYEVRTIELRNTITGEIKPLLVNVQ